MRLVAFAVLAVAIGKLLCMSQRRANWDRVQGVLKPAAAFNPVFSVPKSVTSGLQVREAPRAKAKGVKPVC